MKEYKGSASTDSEKENNTTPVITVPEPTETKRPCDSKFGKDVVVLLDSDSDDSVSGGILVTKPQVWRRREVDPDVSEVIVLSDEEEEELPVEKLQARKQVVENGSTLDGPVESRMIKCGDLEPTLKRKQRRSSCDSQDSSVQAIKKRRDSLTDDSEAEGPEPSWKNQEDMVKKLQRKFPTLEKEELRDVLQEHDWLFEDTLEALSLFTEPVDDSSLPDYSDKEPVSQSDKEPVSQSDKEPVSQNDNGQLTASKLTDDTESTAGCRDVSKNKQGSIHDGRTFCKSKGLKAKTSSPSPSCTADKPLNVVSKPTRVSERKKQPRALVDHYSGSECDSLGSTDPEEHSEYSDSEREDRADYRLNSRILGFFQDALMDELTLIVGCSAKKAQKIVELRPFGTWEDLVRDAEACFACPVHFALLSEKVHAEA